MDTDISRWIQEFFFRKLLDDGTINALLSVLPLSSDDLRLKRCILIRRLESEIASGSVSENVLELLEYIEALDYQHGLEPTVAMKSAYCAVAVECTVSFLKLQGCDREWKYFGAVKRIWVGRGFQREKFKGVGLVSEQLLDWMDDIEGAVCDLSVRKKVLSRSKKNDALKAVQQYLVEAKESMGPSFLESVVDCMSDASVRDALALESNRIPEQLGEGTVNDGIKEMHMGKNASSKGKRVGPKLRKRAIVRSTRGPMLVDPDECEPEKSEEQKDLPSSPVIDKVLEDLELSTMELQEVTKDPLPDALNYAETLVNIVRRKNTRQARGAETCNVVTDGDAPNSSADNNTGSVHVNEDNCAGNVNCIHQSKASKRSLMERNSTARTYEWDDSYDGEGVQLSSPKRVFVSPLKKYEIRNIPKRRKAKKWSTLEADTLRDGVKKYGAGNWKLILAEYRNIFEERTTVDLKDKWRTMMRY